MSQTTTTPYLVLTNEAKMAAGPPNLGNNRSALLSDKPKAKRPRNEQPFPCLPQVEKEDPKFVIVKSTDPDKPIGKYSCFAVHRALKMISNQITSINEIRDGLLLLVKNKLIAKKFTDTKTLHGICNVDIKLHDSLNYTKGTIYAPYLSDVSDEEIVENLKSQGVVSVYKFQRKLGEDNKLTPTGVVLLTFDKHTLPEKIEISWHLVNLRPFYPNPTMCKNCFKIGHTKKRCRILSPVCPNCSLSLHNETPCQRVHCTNCTGEHSSASNTCPKYEETKQLLKIKTEQKCTMKKAMQIYKDKQYNSHYISNRSFSNAVKNRETNKKDPSTNNQNNEKTNKPITIETNKQNKTQKDDNAHLQQQQTPKDVNVHPQQQQTQNDNKIEQQLQHTGNCKNKQKDKTQEKNKNIQKTKNITDYNTINNIDYSNILDSIKNIQQIYLIIPALRIMILI